MKKLLTVLLVLSFVVLSACGGANLLSEEDAKLYVEEAKAVVDLVNDKDWEAVLERADETVQEALTDEVLEKTEETLVSLGAFVEFGKAKAAKQEAYVVVVMPCVYEEKDVVYTISFDEAGRLAGLYFK